MRHRWARSWWWTVRHLAWCERCEKCGAVRKREQRHWAHEWPGIGWLAKATPCKREEAADDRQRGLFKGEVKA